MKIFRAAFAVVLGGIGLSPAFGDSLDPLNSSEFDHFLEFEADGVLPSEEGVADGWVETGAWVADADVPPSFSVAGGVFAFDTTGQGEGGGRFFSIDQPDGNSAWSSEIGPDTPYTFEIRLKVTSPVDGAESVSDPGTAIWLANGTGRRAVAIVDVDEIRWGVGGAAPVIHEGDNASDFVTVRIAFDPDTGWYFVWRNGELIARDPDGTANDARNAVFIVDYGSTNESAGEIDWIRWDSSGAYAPTGGGGDATAPDAPTGLIAQAEDGRVLLDWDDNAESDLLCYTVKRSETSGGDPTLTRTGVFASEFVDDNVTNGMTYYYVVTATDGSGNESDASAEVDATPEVGQDVTPPAAPTGVMATPDGGGIRLDWDDNLEADLAGYDVLRAETPGGPYEDLVAEGVGVSEYVDESAVFLVRYYYVIVAVDEAGNPSTPSAEASSVLTVSIDEEVEKDADEFPHQLAFDSDGVLPTEEGAADGWTMDGFNTGPGAVPPSLDVVGGELVFDTALAGQWALINNVAWAEEVDPGTSYTFEAKLRVTSSDGANPGAVLWLANGVERIIVRVDTASTTQWTGNLLDEGDNTELVTIRVAYDAPTDGYYVWRNGSLVGSELLDDGGDARRSIFLIDCCSSAQATGAFDFVGWDATGAYFPPTDPGDTTPPAKPTGLAGEIEDSRVHLSWNANTEDDLSGYEVGRSETSGGDYVVVHSGSSTTYIDEGLTNGTTYYYVVAAVDVNRNISDVSDEIALTPLAGIDITPPLPPTGVSARATIAGEVRLEWALGPELDASGYNVYRAEASGGPYELLAEGLDLLELEYFDDAVDLGTTYYYVVTAVDLAGNESANSAEVSATPDRFDEFPELAAEDFEHQLHFDEDGVLPSVEGANDGWVEDLAWNIDGDTPPSLTVVDGVLRFRSVLPGQQSIVMAGGSAWAAEVNVSRSYTFEVSVKVDATDAPNPGVILWLANGTHRLILRVDLASVVTWSGVVLDEEENAGEFVSIRVAFHAPTGLYFVWRNGELIGESLPDEGADARTAVFLIDCCSSAQVDGEFDAIYWDATGAYAPGDGDPRPRFNRGDPNDDAASNIADAIFLLNGLFGDGDPPQCAESGDANNDGGVNIADAIYLLNHLFGDGPPVTTPGSPETACGEDPDPVGSPQDIGCDEYVSC